MVVSSRSPRDRTQQETLAGRSDASLGDVGVELVGGGEVSVPVAAATIIIRLGEARRAIEPERD